MEDEKWWRIAVDNWVAKQPSLPSRKSLQAKWPYAPAKVIRSVLQSAKDRRSAQPDE